jgi:hypothetical protein
MSYIATVIKVFISSPGDVKEIRMAAQDACNELTGLQTAASRMSFEPVIYEKDATPGESEKGPQDVITNQLVKISDILVAIFCSRLGTKTPDAPSGTAAEIREFSAAGKPVLIYKWNKETPTGDLDAEELVRLNQYIKKEIRPKYYYKEFVGVDEFKQNLRIALLARRYLFRRVLVSPPRTLLSGYLKNFLTPLYEQINNSEKVTIRLEDEEGKPEVSIDRPRVVVLLPPSIRLASQDAVTQVRKEHFVRGTIVQARRTFGVVLRRAELREPKTAAIYDFPTPLGALYDLIRVDSDGSRNPEVQVDFDTLGQRELEEFSSALREHIDAIGGMRTIVSIESFESVGIR